MNLFMWSYLIALCFLSEAADVLSSNALVPDGGILSSNETTLEPGSPCLNTKKSSTFGWEHYRGFCYWFTKYVRMPWETAKHSCVGTKSHLASIHSFEELNFLRRSIMTQRPTSLFWIGLSAEGLDSSYEWADGTAVDFANWKYPHNDSNGTHFDTCVYLDPSTGYFGRQSCIVKYLFICKVRDAPDDLLTTTPLDTTTTTTETAVTFPFQGACPNDWRIFGEKCYGYFGLTGNDKETWSGANQKCLEMGATMVSIHSQQEQDFVALMLKPRTDMTWIGLREIPSTSDRAFRWTDDSPMDFSYWDIEQPNNWDNHKEECANMRFNSPHFGKWNDAECDRWGSSYLCQIHIDPKKAKFAQDVDLCSEPEGWLKLSSSCYKIFHESENNVTWQKAQTRCSVFGGNLASVRSLRDTTFLRFHLAESQGLFWLGMKNEGQHKKYTWITGPVDYSNWGRGQPFEMPGKPNCVATDPHGRWMVQDCDGSHPFICEVTEDSSTIAPQEPETAIACPNSSLKWRDLGGNVCYIIELTDQTTWYEATHRCFLEGGFLASFHSYEEVHVVLDSVIDHGRPLYIGLAQKHDGGFGWVDKSAVDFSNWETGQPSSQSQMCVEMFSGSGKWNDISCEITRGYICSISKISTNESTATIEDEKRSYKEGEHKLGPGGIIGIILCALLVVTIAVATYCYLYPTMKSVTRLTELRAV